MNNNKTGHNYKARIKNIHNGPLQTDSLDEKAKCYLGISTGNQNLYHYKLDAILNWISNNFQKCHILLDNCLNRHNEYIFKDANKKSAIKTASDRLNNYLKENRRQLKKYSDMIEISRSKQYISHGEFNDDYLYYKGYLDCLYSSDEYFESLIDNTAHNFLERSEDRERKIALSKDDALHHSVQYLLEEISIFCVLVDRGWTVEVYPGPELPALQACLDGEISSAPDPLLQRINVEICLQRKR